MTSDTSEAVRPSGIAGAAERLKSLRAEARLVADEIQAHIKEHEAQEAAHRAEVAAAKKMLVELMPGVDKKAAEAAAFVLTSPTWTQGLVRFMGRNWQYVAFATCALVFWKMLF
jgi:hypothetical protein